MMSTWHGRPVRQGKMNVWCPLPSGGRPHQNKSFPSNTIKPGPNLLTGKKPTVTHDHRMPKIVNSTSRYEIDSNVGSGMFPVKFPSVDNSDSGAKLPEGPRLGISTAYVEAYKATLKQRQSSQSEKNLKNGSVPKRKAKEKHNVDNKQLMEPKMDLLDTNLLSASLDGESVMSSSTLIESPHQQISHEDKPEYCYIDRSDLDLKSVGKEYIETPGRRHKKGDFGRKLGNVVSVEQMNHLLNLQRPPIRMENFHNYYLSFP